MRKKVAWTPRCFRPSSNRGVYWGDGPSSKVSARYIGSAGAVAGSATQPVRSRHSTSRGRIRFIASPKQIYAPGGKTIPPGAQRVEKVFSPRCGIFQSFKSSEKWGSSSCRTPFPGFPHTPFRPVDERFPLFWLAQKPPHLLRRFRRVEKVFSTRRDIFQSFKKL